MKRLLLPAIPEEGARFQPPEDERRHVQDVRRTKEGEILEILDGKGGVARARVVATSRHQMTLEVEAHLQELRDSPLHLEVAVALPVQRSTFDATLPGLVQLGANRIYLVPTEFGGRIKKDEAKYAKRLDTIATQSLKQCGRLIAPEVIITKSFDALLEQMNQPEQTNILLHPVQEPATMPASADRIGLLIGPEGGFSEPEVTQAQEHGILLKGLGPRILKLETAAIGATYWAQSQYGDLHQT